MIRLATQPACLVVSFPASQLCSNSNAAAATRLGGQPQTGRWSNETAPLGRAAVIPWFSAGLTTPEPNIPK